MLWLAASDRSGRIGLGIDQEAYLLAHGRAPPRGSFGLLGGLHLGGHRSSSRFLLAAIRLLKLRRWRNWFGLNYRLR